MSHQNFRLGTRSADMIRKNGRNTMTGKAYWGVLASIFMALAFTTGCGSSSATPLISPVTTVTIPSTAPARQTQLVSTAYVSPFTALVATNGTPAGSVPVTFTVTPSLGGAGGTFANGNTSATISTDSTGTAVSPAFTSNGTVGAFIVTASTQGTTSTAIFSLNNTNPPTTIAATGGSTQSATVSTNFGTALATTVKDNSGNPISGVVVTFTAPASGASGTFADSQTNTTYAITNSSGVATAATFAANATAGGPYSVTASVPVIQSAVTTNDTWISTSSFSLTNTP